MVVVTTEAADNNIVGRGSFRCVHQWRRKLQSSPSTVEGATYGSNNDGRETMHESYTFRLFHQRQRKRQSYVSTIEAVAKEALVLCISDGGRGYARVAQGRAKGWGRGGGDV